MNRALKFGLGGIFFLLPIFILLPPIANTFDAQISESKTALSFLLGSILFSIYLYKKIHPAFAVVNICISLGVVLANFGPVQLAPFCYWIGAVGASLFFIELNEDTQIFFLRCVVMAGVASSILAFFQMMDMDPIMTYAPNITMADRINPIGMMGQTTKFGVLLAVLVGIALAIKDYPSALTMSLAAIATDSSFTLLALGGAILVNARYLFGRWTVIVSAISSLAVFLFILITDKAANILADNGRFMVWEATIKAWLDSPALLGYGLGSFYYIFPKAFQPAALNYGDFTYTHNDYLNLLFDLGWIGIIIIAFCLFFVIKHFYKFWWKHPWFREKAPIVQASEAVVAAILLNAIGSFPFQLSPLFLLSVLSFAIILKDSQGRAG